MNYPLVLAISLLSLVISSGSMIYSIIETRSTVHLDPELERLAIAYFRDQEQRRAHAQTVDAANKAAEEKLVIPVPSQSREFDALPPLEIPASTPKPR